jgi:hypothetical protein
MAASSSSSEVTVYHGDFKAPVRVEQVERGDRMTVDIITTPKIERSATPSSSSSSITGSEPKIKGRDSETESESESKSREEESETEDAFIKKEKTSPNKEPLKDLSMHEPLFSPLLHSMEYQKFAVRADRFMIEFGKTCNQQINGGILSGQSCARLIKILINDMEDNKISIPLMDIFVPLQQYHNSIYLFLEMLDDRGGNMRLFKENYDRRREEIWFLGKPFNHGATTQEDLFRSFSQFYIYYVIQVVNRMLIVKKLKTHTISGRYIMRCVFFVVKMMIFPNIDTPETYMQLPEPIKGKEFELKFLGRNAWLRQAWSLFESIVKYEEKMIAYSETKNVDNALSVQELILAQNALTDYFSENFLHDPETFKASSMSSTSKKASEYRSVIGINNCVLYCYDIYSLVTRYMKGQNMYRIGYDKYYQITHAPWLWQKYRADLEQTEITEKTLTTIDFMDYNSLYDDSKHLHSFRASRTFGVRLPEKYFKMYDGQDIAAVVRSDTELGNVCLDVSTQFGIYDAYNADLSKTQQEVNDMKDILYVKMTDLRNKIAESIINYNNIKSIDDIPDFQSRSVIYDLSTDDTEETANTTKWVKLDQDDPFGLLIKKDDQEKEKSIRLSQIDTNLKKQIRKAVYIDVLKSDIQIAQSLLRYLEQLYGKYYPESKRFF